MAPEDVVRVTDDDACSDTDSEAGSDFSVTETQLAITDGPLEDDDASNPLVSRIGGRPAWLPTKTLPPVRVSECAHCGKQMEMLVQIFAPLDDSPFDRIVLVWGCARGTCQNAGHGCLKAVRILAHNARWEAKLEKKRLKQAKKADVKAKIDEERTTRELREEQKRKTNPFAKVGTGIGPGVSFFKENDIFGTKQQGLISSEADNSTSRDQPERDESDDGNETDELAEEMAIKAAVQTTKEGWTVQDWSMIAPAYLPSQYLNTFPEPSSSARAENERRQNKMQLQNLKQAGGAQELKGWEAETYGNMSANGVDDVFERFVKRVGQHPRQVVRYEFGGQPLPFHARGTTYERLWPKRHSAQTVTSGQVFTAADVKLSQRSFTPEVVPACTRCGGARVFEMQLMPNLVNTLRPRDIEGGEDGLSGEQLADAEAERKREIEDVLGRTLPNEPAADGITRDSLIEVKRTSEGVARRTGLRWNTAMVFVCKADCHDDEQLLDSESWSEEVVLLQDENEQ